MQTSAHSPRTFCMSRNRNWRKPCRCLICPNTGSTIALRRVKGPARNRLQFPQHTFQQACRLRNPPARTRRGRLVMLLSAHGHVRIQTQLGYSPQILLR